MSENSPLDDIACLIAAFEEQKKTIYAHYSQAVASVMTGRITAEKEIERIMDGLLDFADDELFLVLYKKLCRHVYNSYPRMVSEHIALFRIHRKQSFSLLNGSWGVYGKNLQGAPLAKTLECAKPFLDG